MHEQILGFIGAGNMASALIVGLLNEGRDPQTIVAHDPDTGKTDRLRTRHSIGIADNNEQLMETASVLILAVEPEHMRGVLAPLVGVVPKTPPLIVSVAAGIRVASIEKWLGRRLPVIRVMPNTPALVGAGAAGMYGNDLTTLDQRNAAQTLMNAVGVGAWVTDERQLDTVTGVSGSGTAYFMRFMEALVEAAVERGLDRQAAEALVVQTCAGAAALAAHSHKSLTQLRIDVTTPGGTTERGLQAFEAAGFGTIIRNAVNAAADRAEELGATLANETPAEE